MSLPSLPSKNLSSCLRSRVLVWRAHVAMRMPKLLLMSLSESPDRNMRPKKRSWKRMKFWTPMLLTMSASAAASMGILGVCGHQGHVLPVTSYQQPSAT